MPYNWRAEAELDVNGEPDDYAVRVYHNERYHAMSMAGIPSHEERDMMMLQAARDQKTTAREYLEVGPSLRSYTSSTHFPLTFQLYDTLFIR